MIVAGGVYVERCMEPEWNQVYGSAGRAAIALAPAVSSVELRTVATDAMQRRIAELSQVYGFEQQCAPAPVAITFDYVHPLSIPLITPAPSIIERLPSVDASGDLVIRFGMLEGDVKVDADVAVYDPQSAFAPEAFHANGSRANRLAIVLNSSEAAALSGESDVTAAARAILTSEAADVVIVKRGSRGAVVATSTTVESVPAYRSEFVWAIGSGDIFVAAFAFFWGVESRAALDAADLASRAVSIYCETRSMPVLDATALADRVAVSPRPGRVYLAGPFFNVAQRWLVEEARAALQSQGLDVFSPLHDVGRGTATEVAPADLDGLCGCDRVLALVDGADVGTIFELGYAHAKGIPVVAFAQSMSEEDLKMIVGAGARVVSDFTTAVFMTAWL